MLIQLKKFGTTLISRQMGKEAYAAYLPNLKDVEKDEAIEIDFDGVNTFTPSWGDEFLTPLLDAYGNNLILKSSENPSVKATIELLEEINKKKFRRSL